MKDKHWFFNWKYPPVVFQTDLADALRGRVKDPHEYAKQVCARLDDAEILQDSKYSHEFEFCLRLKSGAYLVIDMETTYSLVRFVKLTDIRKEPKRTVGRMTCE